MHYARWQRKGDPESVPYGDPIVRFWDKVDKCASGDCWIWTGVLISTGYGRFTNGGKKILAHRFAYEISVGPIPDGLTLDHLCGNRACVNPIHLEPVTFKVNVLRGSSPSAINARKTHCPYGHPYDETNTRLAHGYRYCIACESDKGDYPW